MSKNATLLIKRNAQLSQNLNVKMFMTKYAQHSLTKNVPLYMSRNALLSMSRNATLSLMKSLSRYALKQVSSNVKQSMSSNAPPVPNRNVRQYRIGSALSTLKANAFLELKESVTLCMIQLMKRNVEQRSSSFALRFKNKFAILSISNSVAL